MERRSGKTSTHYFLTAPEMTSLINAGILTREQVGQAERQFDRLNGHPQGNSTVYSYTIEVTNGDRKPLERAFHELGLVIYDSATN